ncbi:MAG: hypothetical protein RBG13Loki_0047 [Promethearchaeota archaeon CR_4]|nr:MAG: hypothetical protein RBG13Loki_0047 [Candidatus Lokiarchaeota archaeon CR_4]
MTNESYRGGSRHSDGKVEKELPPARPKSPERAIPIPTTDAVIAWCKAHPEVPSAQKVLNNIPKRDGGNLASKGGGWNGPLLRILEVLRAMHGSIP